VTAVDGPRLHPPGQRRASAEAQPIGTIRWRERARIQGHVRSMRLRPVGEGLVALECTVVDATGGVDLSFLGRRRIGGIALGTHLEAEGMVGEARERLTILNPTYSLLGD
jgi:hypothetical protein